MDNHLSKLEFSLIICRMIILSGAIAGCFYMVSHKVPPSELWVGILVWSINMLVGTTVKSKLKYKQLNNVNEDGSIRLTGPEFRRMLSVGPDEIDGNRTDTTRPKPT
jgi:hypothetical protein